MTDDHRRLRELLGSYALGHLDGAEAASVQAHLDGCASCRLELAEIEPLAAALSQLDAASLTDVVTPPADLGARIHAAVAGERVLVEARAAREQRRDRVRGRTRRLLAVAAGLVLLVGGVGIGAGLTRDSAPAKPAVPVEQLTLVASADSPLAVSSAGLVPHTWGLEVRLVGTGFAAGEVFRAAVRTRGGELLPAGQFLGTGDKRVVCNLQAALLRAEASEFVVMDASGAPVLTTAL